MARLKGVKERLHWSLYDAFYVKEGEKFGTALGTMSTKISFFKDIQHKSILETNLESASVLPSENTFEVLAMRLAASDIIPPKAPAKVDERASAMFLSQLIYSAVLTLHVAEKIMISLPAFNFPQGPGVYGTDYAPNFGVPSPLATFRFAEAIDIEPHQSFRAELVFPHGIPVNVQDTEGPFRLWVHLDGRYSREVN